MTKTSTKRETTKSARKSSASPSSSGVSNNGKGSGPSSQESLRKLYAALLRQRMVQEHFQKIGRDEYRIAIGHEAVTAGVTVDLRAEDTIAATASNLAARVARGGSAGSLLKADEAGSCLRTLTPASLPQDPFNLGTGIALAHKFEKKQNVVVAFCDDQSPQLDAWREAFHGAAVLKLPILYVIENGGEKGSPSDVNLEDFSFYMKEYGFPGILADAGDVVAVWRVAQESIYRARNGSGPTLIDCRRLTPQDPLAHMEHYMRKRKVWDDAWKKQLAARVRAEIKAAG